MYTAGVGGSITGKGGNLLIIDDPVKNWAEAQSEAYQQRIIDWYNSTFFTRRQPNSTIIILMTRWHERDLTGYLLETQGDEWEHIKLPAIAGLNDPLGRCIGDALCPERFDLESLESTRLSVGPIVWHGLYQQTPQALEGGIIKRDWIKHWSVLPHIDEWCQSWDLSFKAKTGGSYVVGLIWGRAGDNFYLVDMFRKRMGFVETKDAIREMSNRWPSAYMKYVEERANGAAIIDDLSKEIAGFVPVSGMDSKMSRLSAISGLFERGRVFLPDPSIMWSVKLVEDELCNFPNAASDDIADATSQALMEMKKRDYQAPIEVIGRSVWAE